MKKNTRNISIGTILRLMKRYPFISSFGLLITGRVLYSLIILIFNFALTLNYESDVDYDTIIDNGEIVEAVIDFIDIDCQIVVEGNCPSLVSYTYLLDGEPIKDTYQTLYEGSVSYLEIGETIEVTQYKGASFMTGYRPFTYTWFVVSLIFHLIFLLLGLAMLGYVWVKIRKEVRLYRFGEIKYGEITFKINKSRLPFVEVAPYVHVNYEYRTKKGNKMSGHTIIQNIDFLNGKKIGDIITILVNPQNQTESCVVPIKVMEENNWEIDYK